ncbi:MAG: N-acetyl-gamma-glutamyl-phosphate reductase [Gammaproteobacteria bacterium]|nr:N-acetyl-gamma-glutamyl-phosphate reductase [Gammaproteobacteria bacterium]
MKKIALIGGRGYTGSALLALIAKHPQLSLVLASSNSQAGQSIQSECPEWQGSETFISLTPDEVKNYQADIWVLAVPNDKTAVWCEAIGADKNAIILDLSADHRFDNEWDYGLPEHQRDKLIGSKRIANPGCYATAAQLAIRPLLPYLSKAPHIFGISGYSGAGKTPSPNNDPVRLKDNLIPYRLCHHIHEQEIGHQLDTAVRFMPHVAAFFHGISLTISLTLDEVFTPEQLVEHFAQFYQNEPFIKVTEQIPEIKDIRNTPFAHIGGFTVNPNNAHDIVMIATIDNLLKGAATQAMQNINLSLGFPETMSIVK